MAQEADRCIKEYFKVSEAYFHKIYDMGTWTPMREAHIVCPAHQVSIWAGFRIVEMNIYGHLPHKLSPHTFWLYI